MANGEHVLESLAEMDRYVRLMGKSTRPCGVLEIVRAYLWSWSRERVAKVQRIDAGWAPFDAFQQPTGVYSAAQVHSISNAVRSQCRDLKVSQIELTPDLLALDLFFFFANEMLGRLEQSLAPVRDESRRRDHAEWGELPARADAARLF